MPLRSSAGHAELRSVDERATAAQLGGHTWNVINHTDEHYLLSARCKDHYVDEHGKTTNHWNLDSKGVRETLRCPPSAGRAAAAAGTRQVKQSCQASAPTDFPLYSARREISAAPPTPGRGAPPPTPGGAPSKGPFRERMQQQPQSARVVERAMLTSRRGEPLRVERAPEDHITYRNVDQLRAESHVDTTSPRFAGTVGAASLHTSRGGVHTMPHPPTMRSTLGDSTRPLKSTDTMVHQSGRRLEGFAVREISDWHAERDKLKNGDAFFAKPVQNSGSSCVKYDILSGERKQFWY